MMDAKDYSIMEWYFYDKIKLELKYEDDKLTGV